MKRSMITEARNYMPEGEYEQSDEFVCDVEGCNNEPEWEDRDENLICDKHYRELSTSEQSEFSPQQVQ